MPQNSEVRGVATSIRADREGTHVRYHNTDVVSFDTFSVTLRTGGWSTATTKLRMNQASNQFGLGFKVFQRNATWYVDLGYAILTFVGDELTWSRPPYGVNVAQTA